MQVIIKKNSVCMLVTDFPCSRRRLHTRKCSFNEMFSKTCVLQQWSLG